VISASRIWRGSPDPEMSVLSKRPIDIFSQPQGTKPPAMHTEPPPPSMNDLIRASSPMITVTVTPESVRAICQIAGLDDAMPFFEPNQQTNSRPDCMKARSTGWGAPSIMSAPCRSPAPHNATTTTGPSRPVTIALECPGVVRECTHASRAGVTAMP
jgi:hypothetical protein